MKTSHRSQNWESYKKKCMENISKEHETIAIEMDSFPEELMKYMAHFSKKKKSPGN